MYTNALFFTFFFYKTCRYTLSSVNHQVFLCFVLFVLLWQRLREREQLPVKTFEEEIMHTINSRPVVIIRGATGCGKTTQVPQYILDQYIKEGKASECNIVVTQVSPPHWIT